MTLEILANFIMYLSLLIVIIFIMLLIKKYIYQKPWNNTYEVEAANTNLPSNDSGKTSLISSLPELKKLGILYFFNRVLLFTGVYLFVMVLENRKYGLLESFKELWFKWDSNGYLRIAENWYSTVGDEKYDIALYPLYPILIKAANNLINNYFLSGLFVSNIFLIIGLIFLYKLVKLEFGLEKTAFDSVKYLLIFPFSFFFSIVYTESVFFTLSVLTIYFIRKKSWYIGGVFGLLASFSRNQGLLLLVPVFIELIADIPWKEYFIKRNFKEIFRKLCRVITVSLLIPCGIVLYLLINKLTYGDWFKFLSFQKENWSQQFGFFANNIRGFVFNIANKDIRLGMGVFIPNLIVFFLCLILLIITIQKMRLSYIAYTILYVLVSFSPTWLLSGPRYISGMFTLYIMMAVSVKSDLSRKFAESILCVFLILFAVLFTQNNVF